MNREKSASFSTNVKNYKQFFYLAMKRQSVALVDGAIVAFGRFKRRLRKREQKKKVTHTAGLSKKQTESRGGDGDVVEQPCYAPQFWSEKTP
jgi:hypothetical protein